jgi:hypothetical protein
MKRSNIKLRVLEISEPILRAFTALFKKQCNSFAMMALKPDLPKDLWPWLTIEDGDVGFDRSYAESRFKVAPRS